MKRSWSCSSGYQGPDVAGAQRVSGLFSTTGAAGPVETRELRYPYKVLSGRERPLGSASLGLRIVGVLLYDDGVSVIWRLHGVPSAVTRLVEGATAVFGGTRQRANCLPGCARGSWSDRSPRSRVVEQADPFILLSDDVGTPYRTIETTYQPLEGGEWAGSSDFAPALLEGASTLTLTWEDDSITLTL